jgi:hypothetical protein
MTVFVTTVGVEADPRPAGEGFVAHGGNVNRLGFDVKVTGSISISIEINALSILSVSSNWQKLASLSPFGAIRCQSVQSWRSESYTIGRGKISLFVGNRGFGESASGRLRRPTLYPIELRAHNDLRKFA